MAYHDGEEADPIVEGLREESLGHILRRAHPFDDFAFSEIVRLLLITSRSYWKSHSWFSHFDLGVR
jgi:hypothetical protein